MTKKFSDLRSTMSPEAQARVQAKGQTMSANASHLARSIDQYRQGQVVSQDLVDCVDGDSLAVMACSSTSSDVLRRSFDSYGNFQRFGAWRGVGI